MSTSRRKFLESSAAAAAAGALGLAAAPKLGFAESTSRAPDTPSVERAPVALNLLIIGGTGFTGPEHVEHALARGHNVTLLNRNRTRPDHFKGRVEQLIGDLNTDVSALKGHTFDAALDIPTTFPAWVRNVAQYLRGNVKHYTFISTMSVYPDNSKPGKDESAPTTPVPTDVDPYTLVPQHSSRYYGALKAYAEGEVEKHYPGASLIIRPGLMVGPLDRSDRFTYWPARIDRGGEVLAPGNPNDPVQFMDSRDIAQWTIKMIEARETGVYQATGPGAPLTIAEMLYGIKAITSSGAQFTWVPAAFLASHQVRGWRHMPVWMPPSGVTLGFTRRSNAKAVAKGLRFRPLAETAKATLDWNKTRSVEELKVLAEGGEAGISATKEAEVLDAWKAAQR